MTGGGLRWHEEADLQRLNTLRLPCRARVLAVADDDDAILAAFARAAALSLPVHVLGDGSNVVLPPRLEGVALRLAPRPLPGPLRAGEWAIPAGCNWAELVRQSAAAGLWGLENLALIPGQVGAAPVQNIGAYGQELSECCVAVRALDRNRGLFTEIDAAACDFAYRDSRFRREEGRWLITAVTLALRSQGRAVLDHALLRQALQGRAPGTPGEIAGQVERIRQARLPNQELEPNAGSFFRNPVLDQATWAQLLTRYPDCPGHAGAGGVKVPAAWLIEQAGWRGRRLGGVGVAETHALVLVRHGDADGRDLLALAHAIRDDVANQFGVRLEREPVLLGWSEAPD